MWFRRLASVTVIIGFYACTDRVAVSSSLGQGPRVGVAKAGAHTNAPAQTLDAEIQGAITAARAAGAPSELDALYTAGAYQPLWLDAVGHPTRDAGDALTLLANAADEGLDPQQYGAPALERRAAAIASSSAAGERAAFDVALSHAILRYLRHLHNGRVDPRAIGFRMTAPPKDHDVVAVLRRAVETHQIAAAAATFTPPLVLYRALRSMLAHYKRLAIDEGELPRASRTVKPGEFYEDRGLLVRRLMALGDLTEPDAPAAAPTYDDVLVEAVKHFQMRHGLLPDGVLGPATLAALRTPLARRVRQIELALERLRWLPDLDPNRFVAVNIPMFRVWAWDVVPADGAPSFGTNVIVGRALNTQTPVFVEEMQHIIFRPYWNVPSSILRNEILPILRNDPDYLRRQNMEIVSGESDASPVVPLSSDALTLLQRGQLRVRQRPGPDNALGLVKFVFPNDQNVYMHSTPAPELFGRARRDFSHGCIRLEDPIGLAAWVLAGQGWTRTAIEAAMTGPTSRRVDLTHPIQVIIFYITAAVMPEDGTIRFAEDIYRHDQQLERALIAPPSR